jgi:hypothetical protein
VEQTGQQWPGSGTGIPRSSTASLDTAAAESSANHHQFFGHHNGVGVGVGVTPTTGWGVVPGMSMTQQTTAVNMKQKFYTIQRVNGNGGNGKGDGVAGPHKHSLEDSDRVKKNSVQRWLMKNEREKKKTTTTGTQVRDFHSFDFNFFLFLLLHFCFLGISQKSGHTLLNPNWKKCCQTFDLSSIVGRYSSIKPLHASHDRSCRSIRHRYEHYRHVHGLFYISGNYIFSFNCLQCLHSPKHFSPHFKVFLLPLYPALALVL